MLKAPSTAEISQGDNANVTRGSCFLMEALHLTAGNDNETKFAQNL